MAHYAKVNNRIVEQVIVAEPEFFDTFVDSSPGQWLQTTTAGVPSSAMPAGSVLQVGVSTFEGLASSTANGLPTVITNGAGLFSLSFTPLSATSTLLVQTSSVSCHEESNLGDILWLALWNGSTFIAASSGTVRFSSWTSGLNAAYHSLNHSFSSGSTAARTISVRVGINAGTVYANGGSTLSYNLSGTSARIQMTVMEIAA